MEILILHQYALLPGSAGGTRHFTLAKNLVSMGHDVTIVASQHLYTGVGRTSEKTTATVDGVKFLFSAQGKRAQSLLGRGLDMLKFAYDARKIALDLAKDGSKFDVIVGSSPQPIAALVASFVASNLKKPFVLEVRDLWPLSLRDLRGWGNLHPLWLCLRSIEKYLYRKAAHIITLLPASHDWFVESGAEKNRISVIPNGVDTSLLPQPSAIEEHGKFVAIYAGAHGIANGLDTLVKAGAVLEKKHQVNNIEIKIIGEGPTKKSLIDLAANLNLTCVKFHDPIPKAEVHAELQRSDTCILHLKKMSTFQYGISPNKLFDYLLAGRPIIYAVEAANNPVDDSGAGLTVKSEDAEALADAIVKLSRESVSSRQKMGSSGLAYVKENHDWKVLARKFETVLHKVTSQQDTSRD